MRLGVALGPPRVVFDQLISSKLCFQTVHSLDQGLANPHTANQPCIHVTVWQISDDKRLTIQPSSIPDYARPRYRTRPTPVVDSSAALITLPLRARVGCDDGAIRRQFICIRLGRKSNHSD